MVTHEDVAGTLSFVSCILFLEVEFWSELLEGVEARDVLSRLLHDESALLTGLFGTIDFILSLLDFASGSDLSGESSIDDVCCCTIPSPLSCSIPGRSANLPGDKFKTALDSGGRTCSFS